jgi:Ca2+-binding EF-hand superfamily protein
MSTISGISNSYINATMMQSMKKPDADEMYNKIDADGDGSISEAELTTMQEEMSQMSGQTVDAVSLMSDYDTDGDGLLAREEMDSLMAKLHESMGPPPGPPPTSPETAIQSYLANSEDEEQVSTILDLMDEYLEQLEQEEDDAEEDSSV